MFTDYEATIGFQKATCREEKPTQWNAEHEAESATERISRRGKQEVSFYLCHDRMSGDVGGAKMIALTQYAQAGFMMVTRENNS